MWGIDLDRQSAVPLKRQIYAQIRDHIAAGVLSAGEAVPSTRDLARDLCVSRNTVSEAYDMLTAEGYLLSSQGAATRVAEGLRLEPPRRGAPPAAPEARPVLFSFRTGRPDLRQLPRSLWQQAMRRAAEGLTQEQYGYTGPQGLPELRSELAAWLFRSRGITAGPEDIFITAGATHALNLAAEVLDLTGRTIVMEDPCHSGMLQTFVNMKCSILTVPVDAQGMRTQLLPDIAGDVVTGDIAAVYVTPSHQFPLGGILPAPRRAALIRYARERGVYIIEDDYDSEFRYVGAPVAPLYTLDPSHVIYVGTFSKLLFPALRIGYAVVPRPLRERWSDLRTHDDVQNPPFEQAALAELLRTRKLDRHVQKMRRLYGARRRVLLEALKDAFGDGLVFFGDEAGLHVAVDFPGRKFGEDFRKRCLGAGLAVTPLETHCIEKGAHRSLLLLGYGHLEPDEIRAGIKALRELTDAPYP
jgi:GntR family transcriptional regulator/MocR family aminotransferase